MGFRFFLVGIFRYMKEAQRTRKGKYDQQLKQDSNGLKLNKTH